MDVEILLHGVTNGQSFIGVEEERQYAQLFYGGEKDLVSFTVENRKTSSGVFCYYTYKRAGNIIGYNGRTGSYMAITLRIDKFYADVMVVYNLLELTYKKFVVGNILEDKNSTLSYKIADFAEVKSLKENIESFIISQIPVIFIGSDLKDFDSSICYNETKTKYLNILDCNKASILSIASQTSKIVISPYYDRISESNSKIEYQNKCVSLENLLKQKDSEQSKLSCKNNELIAENKTLKEEVQKLRQNADMSNLIRTIKEPIERLAKMVGNSGSKDANKVNDKYQTKTIVILGALCLITLIFSILTYITMPSGNSEKNNEVSKIELEQVKQKYSSLKIQYDDSLKMLANLRDIMKSDTDKKRIAELNEELSKVKKEHDKLQKTVTNLETQVKELKNENANLRKVEQPKQQGTGNAESKEKKESSPQIEISGPSLNDTLIVGVEYSFLVSKGYDKSYAWYVDGFEILGEKTSKDIKAKPTKSGEVIISYGPNTQANRKKNKYQAK